jgi:putative transposase
MPSDGQIHRKRLHRYEVPGDLRFLTFSCFNRIPLFNNDAIKDLFVKELERTRPLFEFKLYAWVIMPEHVHLLLKPKLPEFPVKDVLAELKGQFSGRVLRRWRKLKAPILKRIVDSDGKQRFWLPGGGHDRNIYTADELEEKINYVHHNPVKRGLVKYATDWRWGSARWYAGIRDDWDLKLDPLSPFEITE